MDNAQMWATLVGFWLPLLISVIQKETWTSGIKAWVAFVACVVAAMGTVYFTGGWTDNSPSVFLLIFVTAVASYKSLWHPTGISDKIEKNILG